MANNAAIEQQDRNLQPKPALQFRVRVDVDDGDRGNGLRPLQVGQRMQHVLAQVAALAADHHEAPRQVRHQSRDYLRRGAGPRLMAGTVGAREVAFT